MATGATGPKVLLAALAAGVAVLLARNAGDAAAWPSWTTYLYNAIQIGAVIACLWRTVAVPAERKAWAAMTLGLAFFAAGDIYWAVAWLDTPADAIPYPSIADALYLALYPCMYVAIGLLLRARADRVASSDPFRSIDAHPSTAVSGVRSSCESVERKSSFDWFVLSATSRACRVASYRRARSSAWAQCCETDTSSALYSSSKCTGAVK